MSGATLTVLSGPSGCGKTTIRKEILKRHPDMLFSVSATTRPIRADETDGKDYFFLTRQEFEQSILMGDLIEYEMIYGEYYGSLRTQVDHALDVGKTLLFDIDVKGALSIKKIYAGAATLIFIEPPSMKTLEERLKNRKTESADALRKRLDRASMELEQWNTFDFCVVNDKLRDAIDEVDSIISGDAATAN